MQTHSMGVKCSTCEQVLVDDLCSCGTRHGHTFQEPSAWAARTWPEHACLSYYPLDPA